MLVAMRRIIAVHRKTYGAGQLSVEVGHGAQPALSDCGHGCAVSPCEPDEAKGGQVSSDTRRGFTGCWNRGQRRSGAAGLLHAL